MPTIDKSYSRACNATGKKGMERIAQAVLDIHGKEITAIPDDDPRQFTAGDFIVDTIIDEFGPWTTGEGKTEKENKPHLQNFALEQWSNYPKRRGWMLRNGVVSERLFYNFLNEPLIWMFPFYELQSWYKSQNFEDPGRGVKGFELGWQSNDTRNTCVKIDRVAREVRHERWEKIGQMWQVTGGKYEL